MKKFTFIILLLVAGAVYGQNAEKKWAIGLGPGFYINLAESKGGFMPELYLSRFLSPSFDLMLKGDLGLKQSNEVSSPNFLLGALNLRYKFNNGKIFDVKSVVQPYLYAGPGYLSDNTNSAKDYKGGLTFNAGIGSKFKIGPNTSLYLEGGYINGVKGTRNVWENNIQKSLEVTDDHLKVSSIIEFAFGKPKDTDGDGVPDRKDKCPDTPAGVKVDANGCPLDRDKDGIPDYKDDCPDTPGLPQFNGCPDKDGDGIPDKDDKCPDVPGLKKFQGCPDTDGDGVPDPDDKCPNTPKGCPVDKVGCPLDTDKDGVIDCEDKCPTVPGLKEKQGCPDEDWKAVDLGPVYFDFDKAVLKSEGKASLDKLVELINSSKQFNLDVSGYTCAIGGEKYNQKLSEKRAQAVVKYLTEKGVTNAYVTSEGYGEEKPAVPNTSNTNRKLNRRAEFAIKVKK